MTFVKLMNKWENNGDCCFLGFFFNNQAALFDIFLLHVEISTAACCDQEEKKNARCEISQSQNSFRQDSQTMS